MRILWYKPAAAVYTVNLSSPKIRQTLKVSLFPETSTCNSEILSLEAVADVVMKYDDILWAIMR